MRPPGDIVSCRARLLAPWLLVVLACYLAPEAHALRPSTRVQLAQGTLLYQNGRYEEAASVFRRLLASDDKPPQARRMLGQVLAKQGKLGESEKQLRMYLKARPQDHEARLALAQVLMARGKRLWAIRELEALRQKQPDNADVHYLLGVALVQQGENEPALELLDRAAKLEPGVGPKAAYHSGVAQLALGDTPAAKTQLLAATAGPFGSSAEELVSRLQLAEAGGPVSGFVNVGMEYDSNVILDPDAPAPSRGQGASLRGVLQGGLSLQFGLGRGHFLGGRLGLYRNFHQTENANDFDYTSGLGMGFYRYQFVAWGAEHEFTLGYRFYLDALDGGPLVEEEDLYIFSEHHGGFAGWTFYLRGWLRTDIQYTYRYKAYHALRRRVHSNHIDLRQGFFFVGGRLKVFARARFRFELARHSAYNVVAPSGFLAVSGKPLSWLDMAVWLGYEWERYLDSDGYFEPLDQSLERTDHTIVMHAEATASYSWLRASVRYEYTQNPSSIDAYDYQRHVISLIVGGAW